MTLPKRLRAGGLEMLRLARPQQAAQVEFCICSPEYTDMSAGVRCLHLLCHHLNRLGYRSFITTRNVNPALNTPFADRATLRQLRRRSMRGIVIYPEITAGNPLKAKRVVRYLLNIPGYFTGVGAEAYGNGEFNIHFWDEFLPPHMKSLQLTIPSTNQEIYCLPDEPVARDVFAVYANRHQMDITKFPNWVANLEIISSSMPRKPSSLACLYQRSRAFVTSERTAAIFEAILCGCPVIVVPNKDFDHAPIVRRYGGNGFCVGFDRDELEQATRTVSQARAKYQELALGLDKSIHAFVESARRYFSI